MYIKGYIDKELTPQLEDIYLIGFNDSLIPLAVVLDTAFNDEFCLPIDYQNQCELIPIGDEEYILGDGSVIQDETFEIQLLIDNVPTTVIASFTDDDEALMGTKMLENKVVVLDFVNGSIEIKEGYR